MPHQGVIGVPHRATRKALEEDAAEAEDIGLRSNVRARRRLLRRHVARRSGSAEVARVFGAARDAEVDQHRALRCSCDQKDVGWLHVQMHHAATVRVAERRSEPPSELEGGGQAQRTALELLCQRGTLQPVHR